MNADELKPCPHCGGRKLKHREVNAGGTIYTADDTGQKFYKVSCQCGAELMDADNDYTVSQWNKRV